MTYEPNNIYCVDCYEAIKQIPDKSIDCIYTDIPYLYSQGGGGNSPLGERTKNKRTEIATISNGIDYSILDEFKRVLKKVNIFIWCSKLQLLDILTWGGHTIQTFLFGAKPTHLQLETMFGCQILSTACI